MLKNRYAACLLLMSCMTAAAGVMRVVPVSARAAPPDLSF